jgi:hypothetical protein
MDNQTNNVEITEQNQLTPIFPCEWCFKFGDSEPQVFAATKEKINDQEPAIRLVLANTEETTVTFSDGDKTFTLFCRPLSEAGETLINQNNQLQDDSSNGL